MHDFNKSHTKTRRTKLFAAALIGLSTLAVASKKLDNVYGDGLFALHPQAEVQNVPDESNIDWSVIKRGEIGWFKCQNYSNELFDCGKLIVPLDYTNVSDKRNASIALIRYKAGKGVTPKSEVKGSLLINPGGPGGSGISMVGSNKSTKWDAHPSTVAEQFDQILDSSYDIVGFDPRGVGSTWPKAVCFDHAEEKAVNFILEHGYGLPGSHGEGIKDFEIGTLLGQAEILSSTCFSHHPENLDLFQYMSTPFVTRDMKAMHLALGDDKLNYWGFSYGTVIGSIYADMFPDDVGRLCIDGVVDVANYLAGLWSNNMIDIEAEFGHFFEECFKSGEDRCLLASLASSSGELQSLVSSWINELKTQPIAAVEAEPPQLLTYYMLHELLLRALYAPTTWESVSNWLYEAIALKNVTALATDAKVDLYHTAKIEDVHWVIACGDVIEPLPSQSWNISDYRTFVKELEHDSANFGVYFSTRAPLCLGTWKARGAERFRGNLTSATSFPLLILGNDFDPVTPARNADAAAERFPNAVSVRREGYGHCSISQPSSCIQKILRDYFVEGKVPEKEIICPVDEDALLFGNHLIAQSQRESSRSMEAISHALNEIWSKSF